MRCPYCREEMEKGYIKSSQYIHWGKERKLGFIPDDLKLIKRNWMGFFEGHFAEAHYCSRCKKIIMDVEQESE